MARQRYTHRRPLRVGARPEAAIRYYRTYRHCHGDTLAMFVAHYAKLWDEASQHGVRAYEGIMRLIELFPEGWRGWITATARGYVRPRPQSFELEGDMPGFLGAVSAACFRHRDGPPPDLPVSEGDRSMRLPPWALLRPRDGEFEEGQSSRTPTHKRIRVERESSSDSSDEPAPIGSDTSDSDDDEGLGEDSDDDEIIKENSEEDPEEDLEEPQIGGSADLGVEFVPPLPVGPPPEAPPPPEQPHPEAPLQPLHPVDPTPFSELYSRIWRMRNVLDSRIDAPEAPVAVPEPAQPAEMPEYPEELLSPIEVPHQGTRYGDPVWISSDSEQD